MVPLCLCCWRVEFEFLGFSAHRVRLYISHISPVLTLRSTHELHPGDTRRSDVGRYVQAPVIDNVSNAVLVGMQCISIGLVGLWVVVRRDAERKSTGKQGG